MADPKVDNDRTMEIVVKCVKCGSVHSLMVREQDFKDYQRRAKFVQDAFPYLSAAERELLISQICGPCFDQIFPPDDED